MNTSYSAGIFLIGIIFFISDSAHSQSTQAMYYLNYPRSISSLGMGEQGISFRTIDDALTFNPVNLIFTDQPQVSYFHQPFQLIIDIPINSFSAYFKLKEIGCFGVEYNNWDRGETYVRSPENPVGEKYDSYERS